MPPITESEVRELRDLITDFREEVRIGIISNKAEIQRVEIQLSSDIKAVDQKITVLDQRLTSLDDRLKTQDGLTSVCKNLNKNTHNQIKYMIFY
jgi:SMC interacting uncharacterized protein involved in chromosome segregation